MLYWTRLSYQIEEVRRSCRPCTQHTALGACVCVAATCLAVRLGLSAAHLCAEKMHDLMVPRQYEDASLTLETAMGLYGLTEFELLWERSTDTKCDAHRPLLEIPQTLKNPRVLSKARDAPNAYGFATAYLIGNARTINVAAFACNEPAVNWVRVRVRFWGRVEARIGVRLRAGFGFPIKPQGHESGHESGHARIVRHASAGFDVCGVLVFGQVPYGVEREDARRRAGLPRHSVHGQRHRRHSGKCLSPGHLTHIIFTLDCMCTVCGYLAAQVLEQGHAAQISNRITALVCKTCRQPVAARCASGRVRQICCVGRPRSATPACV